MKSEKDHTQNLLGNIVHYFVTSNVAVPFVLAIFMLGIGAILLTPKEEEPQIVVPIADVLIDVPGSTPDEVEKLVTTPLEQLLWQVDGVEYVYSTASYDHAVVSVRFYVGEDRERSWVKLYNKINSHINEAPKIVKGWVIKPVEIDDVPIVTLTLHSSSYDDSELRRVGEELRARLEEVEDISRTRISSGRKEQLIVNIDPQKLASRQLTLLEVQQALSAADTQGEVGKFQQDNQHYALRFGPIMESLEQVQNLVVGVYDNKPVYLKEVAEIELSPEEPTSYSRITINSEQDSLTKNSITIELAKKKGTNAVSVAQAIIQRLEELKKTILPGNIDVTITRNYGETASQKINELFQSLLFAVVTVVVILVVSLGWREGMIVALAVPLSFSLALFTNYLFGYTLNRVTLFALILTLGLVVDDPITNVDNIQRHIFGKKRSPIDSTIFAVQEVFTPVVVSTLTIIVSFIPMFFITGMMGPYMAPMATNVPLAVTYSTIIAVTIVPWASYKLLKKLKNNEQKQNYRFIEHVKLLYGRFLELFLDYKGMRWGLFGVIMILLLFSGFLVVSKKVPLKMLPFDNKNELQLVIDMPAGSTLEHTNFVVQEFEKYLETVPEVINFVSYVGSHSPVDFNGLVRHYYFRDAPEKADIRINLQQKQQRDMQSHEIALRVRNDLESIANKYGANLAIVESPPGPPVLSTVVAEIYGPPETSYGELLEGAKIVMEKMAQLQGIVDIDFSGEESHSLYHFHMDKQKSALHGIHADHIKQTLSIALDGSEPAQMHSQTSRTSIPVKLQLPKTRRIAQTDFESIFVKNKYGSLVPLKELGEFVVTDKQQPIFHKNLKRVVYVFSEAAGVPPANVILDLQKYFSDNPLPHGLNIEWAGEGEWFITLRVFRDLGIAFFVALIGIYFILLIQTGSYLMPFVLMSSIPLTAIGILPGFYLLNVLTSSEVGGYANPTFFTATAMIGMIALGGIVVRNSSVLITFIEQNIRRGLSTKEAILVSGQTRMRPIFLTALTTAVGVWPITFDPIFSGLGWAMIFGLIVSTIFSLVVVPSIYWAYTE